MLGLLALGCQNNTIKLEFDTDAGTGMASDSMASSDDDTPATSSPTTNATTASPTTGDTPVTTVSTTASTTGLEVSFFADVAPILQSSCAPGCHEPGGEWQTQDLLNSPYFALVGVPSSQLPSMNKVEPGSLETSYMWHKLNGTHADVGGSGLAMPKNQPMLDPGSLEIISAWIVDGAQNN